MILSLIFQSKSLKTLVYIIKTEKYNRNEAIIHQKVI